MHSIVLPAGVCIQPARTAGSENGSEYSSRCRIIGSMLDGKVRSGETRGHFKLL